MFWGFNRKLQGKKTVPCEIIQMLMKTFSVHTLILITLIKAAGLWREAGNALPQILKPLFTSGCCSKFGWFPETSETPWIHHCINTWLK